MSDLSNSTRSEKALFHSDFRTQCLPFQVLGAPIPAPTREWGVKLKRVNTIKQPSCTDLKHISCRRSQCERSLGVAQQDFERHQNACQRLHHGI